MPRACVIVLDAVGAGALPDADAYGDEGSDTLGNVARAVGGLGVPNLEGRGLGGERVVHSGNRRAGRRGSGPPDPGAAGPRERRAARGVPAPAGGASGR